MTEMIEVSNILNNATDRSFVIFDELGRWTATYDWLALTKAILEYIVNIVKCKTLIATHYHELIALENDYSTIQNHSVSVYETDKEVVFMKKIIRWWASKSYWIDVAKLAGIPKLILEDAKENLLKLEWKFRKITEDFWNDKRLSSVIWNNFLLSSQENIVDPIKIWKYDKVKTLLKTYDLNNMTPLQALQILAKLKEEI
jgi:DNA mismatch repair protein MutS